ncbi:hypothetical protein OC845_002607 [Tilletia horrida]|nr:hypothetical protein OC845_002607 [Tilletia horrida]
MSRPKARSLLQRPVDAFYVVFLSFHLIASLLVDGQAFYPPKLVPAALKQVLLDYIRDSNDPLIQSAQSPKYVWFWSALVLEFVIQVPCFAVGAWALAKDDRRVYPLMIAYAACAGVTTFQCLLTVLIGAERATLTDQQLRFILNSYVPFFAIPTFMLFDMVRRTTALLSRAEQDAETSAVVNGPRGKAVKSD